MALGKPQTQSGYSNPATTAKHASHASVGWIKSDRSDEPITVMSELPRMT
jgi:hypothetical protein